MALPPSPNATSRHLVALLRAALGGAPPPAPDPAVHWETFESLLAVQRLDGLLQPFMGPEVPEDVRARVRERARSARVRTTLALLELDLALRALERAGVESVVLKGAALAQTHYPEGTRPFGDLDLLVPRDVLEPAVEALRGAGFVSAAVLRDEEFYRRHHFHWILRSPAGIALELHWDLTRPSDFVRFDPDGVRARSIVHRTADPPFRTPCAGDHLLHAAQQCLRSGFADLRRVADAALLVREGGIDETLVARARAARLGPALWAMLRLVPPLTAVPVPDAVEAQLRPGRMRRGLLEALELERIAGERRTRARAGRKELIRWSFAPGVRSALRELRRFVLPGRAQLLDDGHRAASLPGPLRRAWLTARRLAVLARMAAQLAGSTARPRGRRDGV